MKPMRLLLLLWGWVTLVVMMSGCGDDVLKAVDYQLNDESVSEDACVQDLEHILPLPAEIPVTSPPVDLQIEVSLAKGTGFPERGKIALIASVYTHEDSKPVELVELFTTKLPRTYPAVVEFSMGLPPKELFDRSRKSLHALKDLIPSIEVLEMPGQVVIYDDVNGNGHIDIGTLHLDDLHHFSDSENEILALTPLSVDILFSVPEEEPIGYRLKWETKQCMEWQHDLEDGRHIPCRECWVNEMPVDLSAVHSLLTSTESWSSRR